MWWLDSAGWTVLLDDLFKPKQFCDSMTIKKMNWYASSATWSMITTHFSSLTPRFPKFSLQERLKVHCSMKNHLENTPHILSFLRSFQIHCVVTKLHSHHKEILQETQALSILPSCIHAQTQSSRGRRSKELNHSTPNHPRLSLPG